MKMIFVVYRVSDFPENFGVWQRAKCPPSSLQNAQQNRRARGGRQSKHTPSTYAVRLLRLADSAAKLLLWPYARLALAI